MSDFRSSICRRSGSRFGCFKVSNGNKAIVESRCTPWWRSWRGPRPAWSPGWSSPWTSASWRRLWRSQRLNWDHVASCSSSFESQVLSRLVSSALSRIEECRRLKEKSSGSDCGSSESDDSYSQEAREVDKQLWREARSCGSSDEGSSLWQGLGQGGQGQLSMTDDLSVLHSLGILSWGHILQLSVNFWDSYCCQKLK